ncbi:MAG: hypothetical protein JWO82_3433 [Akkermansiaceae bacterium]|nr:hypothetical protein [Akkermansiaceae bacterium]
MTLPATDFVPYQEAPVRNTPALVLGIAATTFGVLALLFCWLPFVGTVAVPLACVGGMLAAGGFIVAARRQFHGWILPAGGAGLCLIAIVVSVLVTGSASSSLAKKLQLQNEPALKSQLEQDQRSPNTGRIPMH